MAGWLAVPGGLRPRASTADDMVLAVNMALHVPGPGSAFRSYFSNVSRLIWTTTRFVVGCQKHEGGDETQMDA